MSDIWEDSSFPGKKIAIIGGGAAGYFAAITCAEFTRDSEIVIFEATNYPLAKVKLTGGGRCNLTNIGLQFEDFLAQYPRGKSLLKEALRVFGPAQTMSWFEKNGVSLVVEKDGRVFPKSQKSQTIIDCLTKQSKKLRIELLHSVKIKSLASSQLAPKVDKNGGSRAPNKFKIAFSQNSMDKNRSFDAVLVATGSSKGGYDIAQKLGHQINKPVPALFSFKIAHNDLKDLAGLSFDNVAGKLIFASPKAEIKQNGALVVTHQGFSGPLILKLSSWGAREIYENGYKASLEIDWLPCYSRDLLVNKFLKFKDQNAKCSIRTIHKSDHGFAFPKKLWHFVLNQSKLNCRKTWAEISRKHLELIAAKLKHDKYEVVDKDHFQDEFVTCGGICLDEIKTSTLESALCPNLFFAGEILDVDGLTGGFNLQNAWTTGWIAGRGLARV